MVSFIMSGNTIFVEDISTDFDFHGFLFIRVYQKDMLIIINIPNHEKSG